LNIVPLASKKSESMYAKRIGKLHKDIHNVVVWRETKKKPSDRAIGWSATRAALPGQKPRQVF